MNFLYKNDDERNQLKQFFLNNVHGIDKNKKTVLMTVSSETGTAYFRLQIPLFAMYEKYPDKYNYILIETDKFSINVVKNADIWIGHRAGTANSTYLKYSRAFPYNNKTILTVGDFDDNEYNLPPNHSMRQMWYATKKDQLAKYQLGNVDLVTTTGRELKKDFMEFQKSDNIRIFKNCFNWNLPQWNLEKNRENEPLTIGWAGLTSHYEDVKKMSLFLKVIHDKYPQVQFKIAGLTTKDEMYSIKYNEKGDALLEQMEVNDMKQTYAYRIKQLFKDFDPKRVEFLGVLSLSEYGKFYTMWDINLAYIEHNRFNFCKSPIKVIEGAIYQCINIYSDVGGYKNEFTDLLPSDLKKTYLKHNACRTELTKEWVDKLSFWIENWDSDLRRSVQKETKEFVKQEYDIFNSIDDRLSIYEEFYNRKDFSRKK